MYQIYVQVPTVIVMIFSVIRLMMYFGIDVNSCDFTTSWMGNEGGKYIVKWWFFLQIKRSNLDRIAPAIFCEWFENF